MRFLSRATILALFTVQSVLALPLLPVSSSRFDWLGKFLSGENAAKQGDDSGTGWLWGWGWTWSESTLTLMENNSITFSSRPAAFGLRIVNAPGVAGHLIPTNELASPCSPHKQATGSNFGCPTMCKHVSTLSNESWIAIVERGHCSFVEKVREAQRLGAIAVVVGGSGEPGKPDDLITMYSPGDATDIVIPSCYVSHESYVDLLSRVAQSNQTTHGHRSLGILLGEDEAWQWPVFTFSLLLLLPSLLTLLTLVVHRIRQQRAEVRERAPEDIVNSLPIRVWTGSGWDKDEAKDSLTQELERTLPGGVGEADDTTPVMAPLALAPIPIAARASSSEREPPTYAWFDTQVECAICLSAFERGDRVRVLPCGHVFHIDEVDGWLIKQKKLCPICKMDVTMQPGSSPSAPSPLRAFPRAVAVSSPPSLAAEEEQRPASPTERTPLLNVPSS